MPRIAIVGGGFAGLAAARELAGASGIEVTLYDPKEHQEMLPLLPEILGRGVDPACLRYPLAEAGERWGFAFRNETVTAVDPARGMVASASAVDSFDGMILACGAVADFHGQDSLREKAATFRTVDDAVALRKALREGAMKTLCVVGGGYTGVEVATYARQAAGALGLPLHVLLVEIAPTLCPALAEPIRQYVTENVEKMEIEICCQTAVESIDGDVVRLNDGRTLEEARVVWTAGFRAPDMVRSLEAETDRQGRLRTDRTLGRGDRCYVAGDPLHFEHEGAPLRMGVQLAIEEGRCAARNLRRELEGAAPEAFSPWDPGYIVPMGNGQACGEIMGRAVYGRLPEFLHYIMGIYRSIGFDNRACILKETL